jgi:uncharacterized protein (DUF427 family)
MAEQRGRVRVEASQKRVRTYLGGELVADTKGPVLVWEVPYYPAYYFPIEDVRGDVLVPTATVTHSPSRGDAHHFTVKAGGCEAIDAAWIYPDSPIEAVRSLVRIDWNAMDSWFEEDEEVFVHPRDPHSRVDALPSSRRVRVVIGGVTVAESTHPTLLFETGLPARFYLPKTDVRMDLLTPTDNVTHCPYKGTARYWSARIAETTVENVAWSYPTPLPESIKVAGLVAFYNEHVDIWVDGQLETRPKTPFS